MKEQDRKPNLASKIDFHVQAFVDLHRFSGAILVGCDSKILVRKGYGLANRDRDIPNTSRTKFLVGSIAKQFTAVAILLLQKTGRLHLHEPIGSYLPDCPPAWKQVTIHHLLNHTSGIPNYTNHLHWRTLAKSHMTVDGIVDLFKDKPMDFHPGERQSYSNSGYILLGYIIEQITGKTYETFVAENILKPLGMKDSGYHYHADRPKDCAVGYLLLHDELVNAEYLNMSTIRAAGGLHSTVEDLWLWNQALHSEKIISNKSLAVMFMFTPFLANYGYGVGIAQQFDRRLIGHGGGVEGFSSYLGHYPDEKLCIIVLSNLEETNTAGIAKDLSAIVFAEDYKTPRRPAVSAIDPDILSAYEGQYQLAPGITLTIQQQGKTLLVQASGGSKAIFHHESEDTFFRKPTDDKIVFCRNKKGEVTHLTLRYGGLEESARRIRVAHT